MIRPDGFVGPPLGRKEMELCLWMLRETMDIAEVLETQLRAIEIVAAHEVVAARGRNQ